MRVSHITVLVSNIDQSLKFYKEAFGFELRGDDVFDMGGQQVRFTSVGAPGHDLEMVLSLPMPTPGKDAPDTPGGGTMTVLAVDDCAAATKQVAAAGGSVSMEPEQMAWGLSAVVRDLDGNPFNLVQS